MIKFQALSAAGAVLPSTAPAVKALFLDEDRECNGGIV
jgi:hypothetical protein